MFECTYRSYLLVISKIWIENFFGQSIFSVCGHGARRHFWWVCLVSGCWHNVCGLTFRSCAWSSPASWVSLAGWGSSVTCSGAGGGRWRCPEEDNKPRNQRDAVVTCILNPMMSWSGKLLWSDMRKLSKRSNILRLTLSCLILRVKKLTCWKNWEHILSD